MKNKQIEAKIEQLMLENDKSSFFKELLSLIEEIKISSYFEAVNDISRQQYKEKLEIQKLINKEPKVILLNTKVSFK